MELSTWERLKLLTILPEKGSFVTLKIVDDLRKRLSFTEDEIAELQFREDGDRMMWNPEGDKPKEFRFGPKTTEIIGDVLKKMDEGEALDPQLMKLFEKFVDTTEYGLEGELGE